MSDWTCDMDLVVGLSAALGSWKPDGEGGWDVFWALSKPLPRKYLPDLPVTSRRRAVDLWPRWPGKWSFCVYDPFTESSVYVEENHPDEATAKAVAWTFISTYAFAGQPEET